MSGTPIVRSPSDVTATISFSDPFATTPEEAQASFDRLFGDLDALRGVDDWSQDRLETTAYGQSLASYVDGAITLTVGLSWPSRAAQR